MSSYLQQQIKIRMEDRGLTVNSLEREAGLKQSTVRSILRGVSKKPSAEVVRALANTFGCATDDLLGPADETSVANATAPLKGNNKWDEGLYTDVTKLVLKAIAHKKHNLKFEQVMTIVSEAYKYSIAKSSDKADPDFIGWLIGRYLSRNS